MPNNTFQKWLTDPYFDKATQAELRAIADEPKEVEDRFYRHLEFGTGGLRGLLGAGTNRMNTYVIRQVTQGLAAYITSCGEAAVKRGVAIAHDSRHFSREFALESALILAKNGIKAYVFDSLRPTPELSFAVRELGTTAGIMVTASHNPAAYNGYKVYWDDGGQITLERANAILACIESITDITTVHPISMDAAVERGLYQAIGEVVDAKYLAKIKGLVINPAVIKTMGDTCKIVYSPLHGTGNIPVRRALAELGFKRVTVVAEQEMPDPAFSTVKSPNPEDPAAFALALKLAVAENADVAIATDPDGDRIGVAVKAAAGEYKLLTGNQTGVLITYYILSQLAANGKLPANGAIIKTIVTTDMVLPIAQDYGITVEQTLTGFKFIGEKIHTFEQTGAHTFLFGFEESYGYLAGTFVRDKDAVCAAVLIAEATAYYLAHGKTLNAVLDELMAKYGYYQETLHTITLEGKTGQAETAYLMQNIRQQAVSEFAGFQVGSIEDYLAGTGRNLADGTRYTLTLPPADVVKFNLADGGYVVFRPSGTEPKAKIYVSLREPSLEQAVASVERVKQSALSLTRQILSSFST
ncbi:MAG: phospho-sugar mutase [Peptococcaceae bacterium]|nr:phospho-sugar mutase [Peptococcaceae bacterium]